MDIQESNNKADQITVSSLLSDFETTTSKYLSESNAIAILNFAALFHEELYIVDTALGDTQIFFDSFNRSLEENGIYPRLKKLIKSGILKCLFRDEFKIDGKVIYTNPSLADNYEGWEERGRVHSELKNAYMNTTHENVRKSYLKHFDYFLFEEVDNAIIRYSGDITKQSYRDIILKDLNSDSELHKLVVQLPKDLQHSYIKICQSKTFFTNADLWNIIHKIQKAEQLVMLQGHINQQCYANLILTGLTGSDYNKKPFLADYNLDYYTKVDEIKLKLTPPYSLNEVLEQADAKIKSPGFEILTKLKHDDIIKLRKIAKHTIFKYSKQKLKPDDIEKTYKNFIDDMKKYWEEIIEYVLIEYGYVDDKQSAMQLFIKDKFPGMTDYLSEHGLSLIFNIGKFFDPVIEPVAEHVVKPLWKPLKIRFFHKYPERYKQLVKEIPPDKWKIPIERFSK